MGGNYWVVSRLYGGVLHASAIPVIVVFEFMELKALVNIWDKVILSILELFYVDFTYFILVICDFSGYNVEVNSS